MKLVFFFFLLLLVAGTNGRDKIRYHSKAISADSILYLVSGHLNSLKNIRYELSRELNYASENYHNESKWMIYYDFQSTDSISGLKYQVEDATQKLVFNGTEKIELDKKLKTIKIDDNPGKNAIGTYSAFYNSIITLKNILPLLIKEPGQAKTISDTLLNNSSCYLITINTNKKRIQNSGNGFDAMTTKSNFIYKIIIDKKSDLPLQVIQGNDINNDFIKSVFTEIVTNIAAPPELSWYYSTYAGEYTPAKDKPLLALLSNGSMAPDWQLNPLIGNKTVSLSDFKGNVVLLDFWIKNCGPCIQSIPHLNKLKEKFASKNFAIIGINSYDTKEEVAWFCNKHNTAYKVLLNGRETASAYGVNGFPVFFILDKTGRIIYSHAGFDESLSSAVEQIINNAL